MEQWAALKRLFDDAAGRPPAEWPALIGKIAARDRELARQLDVLLRAHQAAGSFLESPSFDLSALHDVADGRRPRLEPGSHLGPYQILGILGTGGMGEVYRARDERLARDVAIKILPEDFAPDSARHRRMQREARAVGMLNHPNTLTVYDVGLYEGSPFIVSELLEGQTLRVALQQAVAGGGPGMGVDQARRIVREIAEGLGAAHSRGIVHRDLKPENVFVTREGRVKILDFGLAKLTAADGQTHETLTVAGTVLGTAGYMAPEQIRGLRAGPPADVFATGAILYELVTGRRAFEGDSTADTTSAVLTSDPIPLRMLCPSVPAEVVTIVGRCLAKQPEARYQSGAELSEALAAAPPGTRAWRDHRRRLALAALALVAAVAAAIVCAWWLF